MTHTQPGIPLQRRTPWRLVLLTAVVLLAHWAVLRAAPLARAAQENPGPSDTRWSFSTRTLAAEPPPAPTSSVPPRPRPQAVARSHTGAPNTTQPAPDMQPMTAAAPEQQAQPAIESIATRSTFAGPAGDAPVLLAAATPAAKASDSPTDAGGAANRPPAARAVRTYVFPAPARLKYDIKGEVKGFPYHVNGELLWAHDGQTYNSRMEISHFLLGSRVQTSTGQLTRNGLEPTRFGDKVKSEVAAHFEREKNKISFSANTPDVALISGAQDQLSVFMQLAAMFGGDPKGFPPGSTLPFQAVGPRSAESWVFTVGATEKLQMPGGDISAVRLWRDPTGEFDPKAEIWLAPELGYLPVRIRLTQPNGDFVDQQWRATLK